MSDDPFDPYLTHRGLLFTVAYEMLGSAADAEDVLQEAWLSWAGVDRTEVRDERAYLVRIVTRKALDRLRTLGRRREDYVGPWLPEPVLTAPDVADDVELAPDVVLLGDGGGGPRWFSVREGRCRRRWSVWRTSTTRSSTDCWTMRPGSSDWRPAGW